ncbi:phage minor tail protein L [Gibbsiella quercinecans]|uniref:phage minor tail protein L n=1 Tax=Gibbsiella quercinecans TaxID=929813 RepID=UPI00242D4E74|nr:phage minor tail protein L [Gibbsiella quercinecans]
MKNSLSTKFVNCLESLYPGEILTLVEVDATKFGGQVYRFHNENIAYSSEELMAAAQSGSLPVKNLTFQGEEYGPRPFGISGITMSTDGEADKPTITISNIDSQITALVRTYNGLMQAKVTIWVLVKDLLKDDGSVDTGDYRRMIYYVDRPSGVDPQKASFELSSPYDMDGIMIPARLTQTVCYWAQRGWYKSGKGCMYYGQNGYFDKEGNPTDDPSQDVCPGLVSSCRLRFKDEPLDFGGCATATMKSGS